MGFEPFTIPKREPVAAAQAHGTREEKVRALAELLQKRGLTSSKTDALRLAEGMVETEKKVMAQTEKAKDAFEHPTSTTTPQNFGQKIQEPIQYKAKFDERFEKFIAKSCHIKDEAPLELKKTPAPAQESRQEEPTVAQVTQPSEKKIDATPEPAASDISNFPKAIVYSNEPRYTAPEIPHTTRSKQVFFEDAPPITQARGYKGPEPKKVEYFSQQLERFKLPAPKESAPAQLEAPAQNKMELIEQIPQKAEEAPKIVDIKPEESVKPTDSIFEEVKAVDPQEIEHKEPVVIQSQAPAENVQQQEYTSVDREQARSNPDYNTPAPNPRVEPSTATVQKAPEPAQPAEKKPSQDLPKVDIFEFFKKKG